nr:MAG: hypothetical protein [Barnaviridae sp.]
MSLLEPFVKPFATFIQYVSYHSIDGRYEVFMETSFINVVAMCMGILLILAIMLYVIDVTVKTLLRVTWWLLKLLMRTCLHVLWKTTELSCTITSWGWSKINALRIKYTYVQIKTIEKNVVVPVLGELQVSDDGLFVQIEHEDTTIRIGLDTARTLTVLQALQPKETPKAQKEALVGKQKEPEMTLVSPMHPINDLANDPVAKGIVGLCDDKGEGRLSAPFSTGFRVVYEGKSYLLTAAHSYDEMLKPNDVYLWSPINNRSVKFVKKCRVLFYSDQNGMDIALIEIPDSTFAAIGVRALKMGQFRMSRSKTVTVYGFSGARLSCSTGIASHSNRMVNEINYTASTVPGFSGGPVLWDGKVIAIHTSADKGKKQNAGTLLPMKFLNYAKTRQIVAKESDTDEDDWNWISDHIEGKEFHEIKIRGKFGNMTLHQYNDSRNFLIYDIQGYQDQEDIYEDLNEHGYLYSEREKVKSKKQVEKTGHEKPGFSRASSEPKEVHTSKSSGTSVVIVSKKRASSTQTVKPQSQPKKESTTSAPVLTEILDQLAKLQNTVSEQLNKNKVLQSTTSPEEMPKQPTEVSVTNQGESTQTVRVLMIRFSRKQEKLFNRITHSRRYQQGLRDPNRDPSQLRQSLIEYVTSSSGMLSPTPLLDFLSNNSL